MCQFNNSFFFFCLSKSDTQNVFTILLEWFIVYANIKRFKQPTIELYWRVSCTHAELSKSLTQPFQIKIVAKIFNELLFKWKYITDCGLWVWNVYHNQISMSVRIKCILLHEEFWCWKIIIFLSSEWTAVQQCFVDFEKEFFSFFFLFDFAFN